MGKFKVGDRVRCVSVAGGAENRFSLGSDYVVESFDGDLVCCVNDAGYAEGMYDYRFELVPAWQPKVGDRVFVAWGHGWDGEGVVLKAANNYYSVKMETGELSGLLGGLSSKTFPQQTSPSRQADITRPAMAERSGLWNTL